MNCAADALAEAARRDVEAAGGIEAFREHALCALRLKTVIKEPHGGASLAALAFNYPDEEWRIQQQEAACGGARGGGPADDRNADAADASAATTTTNLIASAGGDHVVVYDDRHMGDHVAVVVAHAADDTSNNAATGGRGGRPAPHLPPQTFTTCAWVSARGWTPHPHGDAILAASGASGVVSIISVAEAAVVAELDAREAAAEEEQGEEAAADAAAPPRLPPVLSLSSASGRPGLLLALGGGVAATAGRAALDQQPPASAAAAPPAAAAAAATLWHVPSGRRLALFGAPPAASGQLTCAALHPEARAVVAGDAQGRLWAWPVPALDEEEEEGPAAAARPVLVPGSSARDVTPAPSTEAAPSSAAPAAIDCLQFMPLLPLSSSPPPPPPPRGHQRWALAANASDGRVFVLEWPAEEDDEEGERQKLVSAPTAMEVDNEDANRGTSVCRRRSPSLLSSWRVPAAVAAPHFGSTPDGRYLATAAYGESTSGSSGTPTLLLFVHETRTGRLVCRIEPDARLRVPQAAQVAAAAPRAVALSADGRHAFVAPGAAGLLLRYEARRGCGARGAAAKVVEAATAAEVAAADDPAGRKRGRMSEAGNDEEEQ
jgi:hypothetical protein